RKRKLDDLALDRGEVGVARVLQSGEESAERGARCGELVGSGGEALGASRGETLRASLRLDLRGLRAGRGDDLGGPVGRGRGRRDQLAARLELLEDEGRVTHLPTCVGRSYDHLVVGGSAAAGDEDRARLLELAHHRDDL